MATKTTKDKLETLPDSVFNRLSQVDVSSFTEQKAGLTYLTWSHAFFQALKRYYPSMEYGVKHFDNTYVIQVEDGFQPVVFERKNQPYMYDPLLGYMVETFVTIEGKTFEMHLPVMDGANKAQKDVDYTYQGAEWIFDSKTKRKVKTPVDKTCKAATMFDINVTIMRCLVKNLAMHGVGLNIYAGSDLLHLDGEVIPEEVKQYPETPAETVPAKPATPKAKATKTTKAEEKPAEEKEMPDDSAFLPKGQSIDGKTAPTTDGTAPSVADRIKAASSHEKAFEIVRELDPVTFLATGTLERNWKFKSLVDMEEAMVKGSLESVKDVLSFIASKYEG